MFIIFWNMLFTEDFPLYNIQETPRMKRKFVMHIHEIFIGFSWGNKHMNI